MTPADHPISQQLHTAAEHFVPKCLTLAREARGLLMKEVADRSDITAAALTQLEKGDIRPRPETLGRISMTLGFAPTFFASEPPSLLDESNCHFRRRRSASVLEKRAVLARGSLLLSLANHFGQYVEFPPDRIDGLRSLAEVECDPDRLAGMVRDELGLGRSPIANIVSLLESLGVFVLELLAGSTRLDAFSTWWGPRGVVFLGSDKGSGSRRRFDAGHELAHLIMHRDVKPGDRGREREADRFSSALMLPAETFGGECPRRLDLAHLLELKGRWGASLAAMIKRAHDLGIYSEATYRRGFVQLGKYGWRDGEPNEPPMEHATVIPKAHEMMRSRFGPDAVPQATGIRAEEIEELLAPSIPQPALSL